MAVQVQKIWQQRGWVQKQEQVQKSDRRSGVKSRGRTAGLKKTGTVKSRVSEEHRRADREFEGNRRGQVAGFWTADAVGSQQRAGKARSGRS